MSTSKWSKLIKGLLYIPLLLAVTTPTVSFAIRVGCDIDNSGGTSYDPCSYMRSQQQPLSNYCSTGFNYSDGTGYYYSGGPQNKQGFSFSPSTATQQSFTAEACTCRSEPYTVYCIPNITSPALATWSECKTTPEYPSHYGYISLFPQLNEPTTGSWSDLNLAPSVTFGNKLQTSANGRVWSSYWSGSTSNKQCNLSCADPGRERQAVCACASGFTPTNVDISKITEIPSGTAQAGMRSYADVQTGYGWLKPASGGASPSGLTGSFSASSVNLCLKSCGGTEATPAFDPTVYISDNVATKDSSRPYGNVCKCSQSSGKFYDYGQQSCRCPGGSVDTGGVCACPAGQETTRDANGMITNCGNTCSAGRTWIIDSNNVGSCKCPDDRPVYDQASDSCKSITCDGGKLYNATTGACACPNDKPLDRNGTCTTCDPGYLWDSVTGSCKAQEYPCNSPNIEVTLSDGVTKACRAPCPSSDMFHDPANGGRCSCRAAVGVVANSLLLPAKLTGGVSEIVPYSTFTLDNDRSDNNNNPSDNFGGATHCVCAAPATQMGANPITTAATNGYVNWTPAGSSTAQLMRYSINDVGSAISPANPSSLNLSRLPDLVMFRDASSNLYCGCPNFNENYECRSATVAGLERTYCGCWPSLRSESNWDASAWAATYPGGASSPFVLQDFLDFDPSFNFRNNASHNHMKEMDGSAPKYRNSLARQNASDTSGSGERLANTFAQTRRKIWKCANGTELNKETGVCQNLDWRNHKCDESVALDLGGGLVLNSSVKTALSTSGKTWDSVVNKKLACCAGESASTFIRVDASGSTIGNGSVIKYSCLQSIPPKTVDATDAQAGITPFDKFYDAGNTEDVKATAGLKHPNRLYLTDASGKPLVGFFKQDGTRCDDAQLFGANFKKSQLLEKLSIEQNGMDMTVNGVTRKVIRLPSGNPDCRFVVRAALETRCPRNPESVNNVGVLKRLCLNSSGQQVACGANADDPAANITVRCPGALEVRVHYDVQDLGGPNAQDYLAGSGKLEHRRPAFKNYSTLGGGGNSAGGRASVPIPIGRIIEGKNSGCPAGFTMSGSSCIAVTN